MTDLRNDTAWQQGFVLDKAGAVALGLVRSDAKEDLVVVIISHDCDLMEPTTIEPICEIIVGRKIPKINGLYANGKNPRRLHLSYSGGAQQIFVELLAADKRAVKKDELFGQTPEKELRLTTEEHFGLQLWLATRYCRSVFPNEFDRRLKAEPTEVHKKIANTVKGAGTDLVAVLFDVDDEELASDVPYSLGIVLVYNVSDDPARAKATAIRASSTIKSLFRQYFFSASKWREIELRECLPVSADAVSIHQLRSTKPWYFDYLEAVTSLPTA